MNATTRCIIGATVVKVAYLALVGIGATAIGIGLSEGIGPRMVYQTMGPMFWFSYAGTITILSLLVAIVDCQPSPDDRA